MVTDTERKEGLKTSSYLADVPSGGTIIDGGANVGVFAREAEKRFDRVVCVEANPLTFQRLEREVGERMVLINAAIGPTSDDTVYVSNPRDSTRASCSRTARSGRSEIRTISLDDLCRAFAPTVIKLDIEGSEYEALEQWSEHGSVTGLVIEFHRLTRRDWFGRFAALKARLAEFGFVMVSPMIPVDEGRAPFAFSTMTFERSGARARCAAE